MKGKKIAVLSLALSSLLAFTVAGVACNKGGGGTNAGSETAVSLISDSTLTDKFFALYTFEDTGDVLTAINPYTGAIADTFNGSYLNTAGRVTNPKKQADASGSQYVLDTDAAVRLGNFSSVIGDEFDDNNMSTGSVQDGLSFSFWAYNNETIVGPVEGSDESADWANMIYNGYESINWGNLTHNAATTSDEKFTNVYPMYDTSGNMTVGRGAYTDGADGSYEAARDRYSTDRLSRYNENYAVWNAVSGNRQDGSAQNPDNEYIEDVAAAYLNNWRYLTVNIDYAEGLSFYVNGRLAYRYAPKAFEGNAPMVEYGGWQAIYADFVLGAIKSGSAYIDMFGAECGITVDDLIVGKSITETDACALYEDITGNTWTEDDLKLESAASAIDQEKAAFDAATLDALLEGVQTPVEGDVWGSTANPGTDAGVKREDTNDDGLITDTVYDAREAWLGNTDAWTADGDGYKASDFSEQVGALTYDGDYQPATSKYYKPTLTDGKFNMTVSGVMLSEGSGNWQNAVVGLYHGADRKSILRVDNVSNGTSADITIPTGDANPTSNMKITWVDTSTDGIYLNVIQRFCKLDIVFAHDGTSLTITYRIYYYFAGESYSTTLTDGTPYTYTVPKDSSTLYNYITYTVTPAAGTTLDYNALALRFGYDHSCFLISSVTGGEATDTPPEVNVSDEEQARADAIAAIEAKRAAAWKAKFASETAVETIGAEDLSNGFTGASTWTSIEYKPTNAASNWEMSWSGYLNSAAADRWDIPLIGVWSQNGANVMGTLRADYYIFDATGTPALISTAAGGADLFSIVISDSDPQTEDVTTIDWNEATAQNLWKSVIEYAKVKITIKYDGSALTFVWNVEAFDKGQTYEEDYSWTGGSDTASVTVPDESYTITATITDATALAECSTMSVKFGSENSYFVITEATGCDYTPVSAD